MGNVSSSSPYCSWKLGIMLRAVEDLLSFACAKTMHPKNLLKYITKFFNNFTYQSVVYIIAKVVYIIATGLQIYLVCILRVGIPNVQML